MKRKFVVKYNSKTSVFCVNCDSPYARLSECPAYKSILLFLDNSRSINSKIEDGTVKKVKTLTLDIQSIADPMVAKKKVNTILAQNMKLLCETCCYRKK